MHLFIYFCFALFTKDLFDFYLKTNNKKKLIVMVKNQVENFYSLLILHLEFAVDEYNFRIALRFLDVPRLFY